MKPRYRTPFEGLILRDGRTKGSNPPRWYFWHRWTRSETVPPPVFTSASHPLEIAFLSRAGLPDDNGPIGFCMLPGRRKAKRSHRWARDLGQDIAAIRQDRLCLVTLCTQGLGARCVMIGTLTAGQFGIFDIIMGMTGAKKFHFHDPSKH